MAEPGSAPETPQFDTAEFHDKAAPDWCRVCKQSIVGSYYRVNGQMACAGCAELAKANIPANKHSAFAQSLVFGAGGAVLGLVIYAGFGIITGWMIGYISLAVGWIVGKAMMKGSGGLGGRRYQIAAVLFTYFAVSVGEIPIVISQYMKSKPAQQTAQSGQQTPGEASPAPTNSEPQRRQPASFGSAVAQLLLIGLASPFLELQDPLHGLIGLVILFVGLQIAWRIAAGNPLLNVEGPYSV